MAQTKFTAKAKAPEFRLMGTAMFANVFTSNMKPEKTFERKDGSGSFTKAAHWSVDVVLQPNSITHANKLGMQKNIRTPDEYQKSLGYTGPFISFTKNEKLPDGTIMKPPVITDSFGEPITDFIGNGSSVEVIFSKKDGKEVEKYGPNIYLKGLVVRDLIPWNGEKDTGSKPVETTAKPTKPTKPSAAPIFDDELPTGF